MTPDQAPEVVRIGNGSGFYGDRLGAMREMLEGGDLDYLTGDYLAELTMLILGRDQLRDASLGYARTFLRQAEDCLGLALEKGVRLVSNAGGLNPAGLAGELGRVAKALGVEARIAHVDGDNLIDRAEELGLAGALTANAYLGAFGIAHALDQGADVVVTGRVTDASVVLGPAISAFGWQRTSYDALAGAVVAGHVVECGAQACGGNFSGFLDLARDARPIGFPIAEVAPDGSCTVTKHKGTGGAVTVDTVTAQLVYEVQSTHYLGPDVTTDLTTVRLEQDGEDRVRISGVRGSAPPPRLKVCVNELGGHRNQMELVLTGLDLDEKADWARTQLEARLSGEARPASVVWSLGARPQPDADTEEGAACLLRCVVRDADADKVGRAFSAAAVELALASYPGFHLTSPPGRGTPYGVYRAAYVDRGEVVETVHLPWRTDDDETVIEPPATTSPPPAEPPPPVGAVRTAGQTQTRPLGTFVHARSGDKGGDANVGLWVRQGPHREERVAWLLDAVTPELVRALAPEAADLEVEVHRLPNLGAVNVLLRGLLGEGVAASARFDPQAKAVGEWLRSRLVRIPEELL